MGKGEKMEQRGKQRGCESVSWEDGGGAVPEARSQVQTALLRALHMTPSGHSVPSVSKANFGLSNSDFTLSSQMGCRELCKVSIGLASVSLSSSLSLFLITFG